MSKALKAPITKHKFYRSTRTSRGMRKTKELRRFLLYSLYAWGVPTILTAITFSVDYWHIVPDIWSPKFILENNCWFTRKSIIYSHERIKFDMTISFTLGANWQGHFIFFLLPIGLHAFTNVVLFVLTAIHCNKIKSEITRMQCAKDNEAQDKKRKFLADRAKYMMNIKLFIVMGVTWLLEILATLYQDMEQLWYFSDIFNILQGVLVFVIFVCKAKVWEAIKQRLGINKLLTYCFKPKLMKLLFHLSKNVGRAPKNSKRPTTVTTQLSVTSNGKLGKSSSTSTLSTSNTNLNVIRKVA